MVTLQNIQKSIERCWEIDPASNRTPFSEEELQCEEYFKKTVQRNEDERFVIKLPFKSADNPTFGDSKELVVKDFFFGTEIPFKI